MLLLIPHNCIQENLATKRIPNLTAQFNGFKKLNFDVSTDSMPIICLSVEAKSYYFRIIVTFKYFFINLSGHKLFT